MRDMMDEIMGLVSQAKSDLAREIGLEDAATQERVKAARYNLGAAVSAARQGEYHEALRLFKVAENVGRGWVTGERVGGDICGAGDLPRTAGYMRATRRVWQKANALEPDNEELKRIAVRLGLVKA